jgi:NADPH:quinone reductase-like Zn-dependent oxidoreductase
VATLVDLYAHRSPGAKILEIRAGEGCSTLPVLETLGPQTSPRFSHYDVTDLTSDLLEVRRNELKGWGDLVDFKLLDVDIDPAEQTSIQCNSYDFVIFDRVSSDVKQVGTALLNIRKLLNDKGKVLIIDANDNYQSRDQWDYLLRQNGFDGLDQYLMGPPVENGLPPQFCVILGSVRPDAPVTAAYPKISIVYDSETAPESWIQELVQSLASLTNAVSEIERLDQGIEVADDKLYICIAELARPILSTIDENTFTILRSLLTSAKAVLWVTRGGALDCEVPDASLVTGLFRTLRNENPSTQYFHVDVDPAEPSWSFATVDVISRIARRMLCGDFKGDSEYAQRNGHIMIPRVIEDDDQNTLIYTQIQSPIPTTQPFHQSGRPLRMEVGTRGLLDSLRFVDDPIPTTPLPTDFVEIEPKAFGLNFRDIMVAMGQLNEMIMGYECSGVIIKIGSAVSGLKVGDRVIGLTRGHYANILRLQGRNVIPVSDDISFETAASIPIVFATAYYSLYECARLRKGETVLIHAAAGGVGQAAIMLAQLAGAEVFATAGTNEKRDFLVSTYGVPPDHIFSSRSTAFAKQVLSATDNKGADVILNCLAGEILHESWNCIAALGRFVEIGKRDFELNNHLEMRPFTRNVAFFSVDLTYLLREKSQVLTEILTDVIKLLREKKIHPVQPTTVFPIAEVERAFRLMQAGKHRGKVIIQPNQGDYVKVC